MTVKVKRDIKGKLNVIHYEKKSGNVNKNTNFNSSKSVSSSQNRGRLPAGKCKYLLESHLHPMMLHNSLYLLKIIYCYTMKHYYVL